MTYRYLEEIATADIAFEATAANLEDLFIACADATLNVMIENIGSISPRVKVPIELKNNQIDLLLFDLLQEILFYKDAQQLLLRIRSIHIESALGHFGLVAVGVGEKLDPTRHSQRVDVKAVTLYNFLVEEIAEGQWRAVVILDV
jgi:SHS2 domain-containing protein